MVTWDIAENNPGALAFMMDAYGLQPSSKSNPFRAEQAFSRMKHHCITGVDLYILWNDCCGRDTAKAIKIMCEKEICEIRKHLNHGMTGIPFEDEKDLPSAEPDAPDNNVGDLISREAMSYAVNTIRMSKNETCYSFYQKVLDVLSKLPSAQPEPPWIPCSERLPEMPGWYLISKIDDVFDAYFSCDEGWEIEAFEEFRPVENVIAWMPKPEPYHGTGAKMDGGDDDADGA